jgi:hypothetical protein
VQLHRLVQADLDGAAVGQARELVGVGQALQVLVPVGLRQPGADQGGQGGGEVDVVVAVRRVALGPRRVQLAPDLAGEEDGRDQGAAALGPLRAERRRTGAGRPRRRRRR